MGGEAGGSIQVKLNKSKNKRKETGISAISMQPPRLILKLKIMNKKLIE